MIALGLHPKCKARQIMPFKAEFHYAQVSGTSQLCLRALMGTLNEVGSLQQQRRRI